MAKQLDSLIIKVEVLKDVGGDTIGKASSFVVLQTSEYPDMGSIHQPGNAPVTSTLEDLATNLADLYLAETLIFESAEDNIPIPTS